MSEYHEDIEASLLTQGVDLLDFYRGSLSARRLLLLIERLPRESPFKQAVDPKTNAWSVEAHLAANLIDLYGAAHGVKQPVRRPGDPDPEEKTRAVREQQRANFEARQRAREQQREAVTDG